MGWNPGLAKVGHLVTAWGSPAADENPTMRHSLKLFAVKAGCPLLGRYQTCRGHTFFCWIKRVQQIHWTINDKPICGLETGYHSIGTCHLGEDPIFRPQQCFLVADTQSPHAQTSRLHLGRAGDAIARCRFSKLVARVQNILEHGFKATGNKWKSLLNPPLKNVQQQGVKIPKSDESLNVRCCNERDPATGETSDAWFTESDPYRGVS